MPVSLREHLTLIEAMDAGPAIYDVDAFYYLARAALVKDERHLDRFDRVIGEVFMSRFERQEGAASLHRLLTITTFHRAFLMKSTC